MTSNMTQNMHRYRVWGVLCLAVVLQFCAWHNMRHTQSRWTNVPTPPTETALRTMGLGDAQFSYRQNGLMLQNMGSSGAHYVALKDYNMESLGQWFFLMDKLAPKSHFVPFLAAYYFGSSQDPSTLRPLIEYLGHVGQRPGGERWRWLGQAVYLARFKLEDQDLALSLARKLAALHEEGLPAWTKQMPAFILNATGSKEEAAAVMLEIIKTSADKIDPNELNFTIEYICDRILSPEQARGYTFCESVQR